MKKEYKLVFKYIALILAGLFMQVGAAYILNIVLMMIQGGSVANDYEQVNEALTTMEPKILVYVAFFSPLVEELIFRLGLIGLTRKYIKFWIINIIQAVLFGVYHGNLVQGTYAFAIGLLLGFVFEYAGGYIASLMVHIVINVSGLYVTPLLPSDFATIYKAIIGIVFITLSLLCVTYSVKDKKISEKSL